MTNEDSVPLLTEREVSNLLKVSVHALRRWRLLRQGPGYFKLGTLVRYDPAVLASWVKARSVVGRGEGIR